MKDKPHAYTYIYLIPSSILFADRNQEKLMKELVDLRVKKDDECKEAIAELRLELRNEIEGAYKERDDHLENYTKERKLRKKLHNKLLEIQGR
jgi:hypothetical protein